jgi:hypothetical protein
VNPHVVLAETFPHSVLSGGTWRAECLCGWNGTGQWSAGRQRAQEAVEECAAVHVLGSDAEADG